MIVNRIGTPRQPQPKQKGWGPWLSGYPADLSWLPKRRALAVVEDVAQPGRRFNPSLYFTTDTLGWLRHYPQPIAEEPARANARGWFVISQAAVIDNLEWSRRPARSELEPEQVRKAAGWLPDESLVSDSLEWRKRSARNEPEAEQIHKTVGWLPDETNTPEEDALEWLRRARGVEAIEPDLRRAAGWLPEESPSFVTDNLEWRLKRSAGTAEDELARRVLALPWLTTVAPVLQLDWFPVRREPAFITPSQPQVPTWVWITSPLVPGTVVRPVGSALSVTPVASAQATTPEAAAQAANPDASATPDSPTVTATATGPTIVVD